MSTTLRPAMSAVRTGVVSRVATRTSASSAVAARFGQPIAASAPEAAPSMGNSDGRSAAERRDDAEFKRVARQEPAAAIAGLKLKRKDGDRVSGASGEHDRHRIGSQRGVTALHWRSAI